MIEMAVLVTYGRWYPNGIEFRRLSATKDVIHELLNHDKLEIKLYAKDEERIIIVDWKNRILNSEEEVTSFIHRNLKISEYSVRLPLLESLEQILSKYLNSLNYNDNSLAIFLAVHTLYGYTTFKEVLKPIVESPQYQFLELLYALNIPIESSKVDNYIHLFMNIIQRPLHKVDNTCAKLSEGIFIRFYKQKGINTKSKVPSVESLFIIKDVFQLDHLKYKDKVHMNTDGEFVLLNSEGPNTETIYCEIYNEDGLVYYTFNYTPIIPS